MTPIDAHKAIYQRWLAVWHTKVGGTQAAPTVRYAIDNRKLQQPTPPPFARVEIQNIGSDQATMGPPGQRRFLREGFIEVRLYDLAGQGRGRTDVLAEYVRDIYESTRLGADGEERGIVTYAMDGPREVRDDKEFPDLWCVLCRIPFEYHHRR